MLLALCQEASSRIVVSLYSCVFPPMAHRVIRPVPRARTTFLFGSLYVEQLWASGRFLRYLLTKP